MSALVCRCGVCHRRPCPTHVDPFKGPTQNTTHRLDSSRLDSFLFTTSCTKHRRPQGTTTVRSNVQPRSTPSYSHTRLNQPHATATCPTLHPSHTTRASSRYPTFTLSSASPKLQRDTEHAPRYSSTLTLLRSYMQCGNPQGKPGELEVGPGAATLVHSDFVVH